MIRVPEHTAVSTVTNEDVCKHCHGRGYLLYHVDARELDDVYGGEDIASEYVKKCPYCSGKPIDDTDLTNVPDMFREADIYKFDFETYEKDISKYKDIAFNFFNNYKAWQNANRGIYLWSKEPGSGKTFLACCLGKSVMMKYNIRMRFISVPDYMEKLSEWYTIKKNGGFMDPSKTFREADLLIFDDIGAQQSKEWDVTEIFRLVDYRLKNGKVTIFTSNMPIEKLNIDERAKSRIMATTIQLHMPEESIRQKKSQQGQDDFLKNILKEK